VIEMSGCLMDGYLVNSENWNFHQQIDYSINQVEFVDLSNVHEHISFENEINSNNFNHPLPSPTMVYELPLSQPTNIRWKKYF